MDMLQKGKKLTQKNTIFFVNYSLKCSQYEILLQSQCANILQVTEEIFTWGG